MGRWNFNYGWVATPNSGHKRRRVTIGEVKLLKLETEARALGICKVPEFESASRLKRNFSPFFPQCLVTPEYFQGGHSAQRLPCKNVTLSGTLR